MGVPRVARLTVYPIKSLDGKAIETAHFTPTGGFMGDRTYALFDADGAYVNGKAERRLHRIRTGFDLDTHEVRLRAVTDSIGDAAAFSLPEELVGLAAWFTDYLGYEVEVRRDLRGGFPDDTVNAGPTVISTATIETVAGWFEDVSVDEMRRRLRASVEVAGVPAFWEDRLVTDEGEHVEFRIGDVLLHGANPCQRCIVPARDPDTGEETPNFRERFLEGRRETRPDWTDSDRFDHDYRVMVNTRVPDPTGTITVGDRVEILGTVSAPADVD
jgi:hypothetical protein